MKIKKNQAARLAGFFDGEGCITFGKSRSGRKFECSPRIRLVNTSKEIMSYVKSLLYTWDIKFLLQFIKYRSKTGLNRPYSIETIEIVKKMKSLKTKGPK